jgi:DNA gyrase subunit A
MNLKFILQKYIDHRHEIVLRRTNFDLRRAKEREHILEGLKIAVDNIDRVIEIIRASSGPETAKIALMDEFELTDIQAKAILEMRLAKLTGLERQKLIDELTAITQLIVELENILASRSVRMDIIKDELDEILEAYGDDRRTEVIKHYEEFTIEDMIAEEEMVVTISNTGYIKRQPVSSYRRQGRGGRGKTGAKTKEEDFIEHLFIASTHDFVLFFTDRGQLHWLKVYDIPQLGRMSKGKAIVNLLELSDENIAAFVNVKEFAEDKYLIICTKKGTIKKTALSAYSKPRRGGIIGINIHDDDELISAAITDGNCEVILGTSGGKAVRFRETDARPMGRSTAGVKGVKLPSGQYVVGMVVVRRNGALLVATDKGYGKRSEIGDYRLTKRGAGGVITLRTSDKIGNMIAIMEVVEDEDLMIITINGVMIRLPVKTVRVIGRATQGVRLIKLDEGDSISSIAQVARDETEDSNNGKSEGDILDEPANGEDETEQDSSSDEAESTD